MKGLIFVIFLIYFAKGSLIEEARNATLSFPKWVVSPIQVQYPPAVIENPRSMMEIKIDERVIDLSVKDMFITFEDTDKDALVRSFKISMRNLIKEHQVMKRLLRKLINVRRASA
jgi:hypothetical protein